MAVPSAITDLSVTAASNSPAGSDSIGNTLDDFLRAIQAIVRREQAQGAAVASAATTNIGATTDGAYIHITGTTTITSFGTVAAGISRVVVFDGALTLTHNATSLILPGAANITTAAGDVALFISEGSGNWRCLGYQLAATAPGVVVNATNATNLTGSGTISSTTTATTQSANDSSTKLATTAYVLGTNNTYAKAQRGAVTALTDAATVAVDLSLSNNFSVTLGGNRTLGSPTNMVAGQSGCITITQDGTGSRTLAYNATWKFAGGTAPVLSTTASAVDILTYYVQPGATTVYASLAKGIA